MKTTNKVIMKKNFITTLLVLLGFSSFVLAQTNRSDELANQPSIPEIKAIAKEAFIYAYPMLYNYKTLQEQTQDQFNNGYIGGFGQFGITLCPLHPKTKILSVRTTTLRTSVRWLYIKYKQEEIL